MNYTGINIQSNQDKRDKKDGILLHLDIPNETTAAAIEEGRRIAYDKSVKGYTSIDALKKALDS